METVTISKEKLLTILQANRVKHEAIYQKALTKWREAATKELVALAEKIGGLEPNDVKYPKCLTSKPECHLEDYDQTIEMLKFEVNPTVELERHHFQQYVQDKWVWQASFAANSLSYIGKE